MVENFTTVNENTYDDVVKEDVENSFDQNLEEYIKRGIQGLKKNPSQKTIDSILDYSKSLNK